MSKSVILANKSINNKLIAVLFQVKISHGKAINWKNKFHISFMHRNLRRQVKFAKLRKDRPVDNTEINIGLQVQI